MPAGNLLYSVRTTTAGAAAVKDQLQITGVTNLRFAVVGLTVGDQAATSAGASDYQLVTAQTAATGTGTVSTAMDQGNSRAAASAVVQSVTTNATGTITIIDEFAFDIVGSYTKWFPPGKEIWIQGAVPIVLRKAVGTDTNAKTATMYWAE